MQSLLSAVLLVAGLVIASGAVAAAEPMGALPPAPIGHAQPRARDFSPGSPANQTEQDQLSTFDAQQQKQDEMLDKKLNICRNC